MGLDLDIKILKTWDLWLQGARYKVQATRCKKMWPQVSACKDESKVKNGRSRAKNESRNPGRLKQARRGPGGWGIGLRKSVKQRRHPLRAPWMDFSAFIFEVGTKAGQEKSPEKVLMSSKMGTEY